jgi:hypothetical protein
MSSSRSKGLAALSACLAACLWPALGNPIQLRPPVPVQAGGVPLQPGRYAIPCATDWNGDGRKDLLVGFQDASKIAVFYNSGTDAQPVFTNYSILQFYDPTNGWTDIRHPSSGCGAPAPWVCDFDGDGRRDLLVGAGQDGTVWFYRNTNTDADPRLVRAGQLQVGADKLSVASRATPYVHDWDENGLPDLLCGAGDGYLYFFRNTNTAQSPIYAPAVTIRAGGTNLFLGIRSVIRVLDWDGDGLKDLVCSSDTGVYWCRNTNSNSNPILQAPVPLQVPNPSGVLTNIVTGPVPGARMRVFLTDWNKDGVMDLLLGNADGTVYYFEGYQFAFTRVARQPMGDLLLQWSSAPYLRYNVLLDGCLNSSNCSPIANLPSGGTTTFWTNPVQAAQGFYRVQVAP